MEYQMKLNLFNGVISVFAIVNASKPGSVCSGEYCDLKDPLRGNKLYEFTSNLPTASWLTPIEKSIFGLPECRVLSDKLSHEKEKFLVHLGLSSSRHNQNLEEMKLFLNWDQSQDDILDFVNVAKLYSRDSGSVGISYDMTSAILRIGRRNGCILSLHSDKFIQPFNDCFDMDLISHPITVFGDKKCLIVEKNIVTELLSVYISNVTDINVKDKISKLQATNGVGFIKFLGDVTGIKPIEGRLFSARMLKKSYPEHLKDWINLNEIKIEDNEYQSLILALESISYKKMDSISNEIIPISILDNNGELSFEFLYELIFSTDREGIRNSLMNLFYLTNPEEDASGLTAFFDNFIGTVDIRSPSTIKSGALSAVRLSEDLDLVKHRVVQETFDREFGVYGSAFYGTMMRAAIGI
jgi:hypothetical protein